MFCMRAGRSTSATSRGFLIELASRNDLEEVRFDPRFLERSMEVLADRLPGSAVAPVEPYSNAHRQALAALERTVLEGTLRHGGGPAVSQQLLAAACDRFDNGDPRRIRKLDRTPRSTRRWRWRWRCRARRSRRRARFTIRGD
jgi:hypothetical protein